MNRDLPIFLNIPMHFIWIKYSLIAKLYLSFIHTPLHYLNTYYLNPNKFFIKLFFALFITIILQISLEKNYHLYLDNKFQELWWVSPILAHIYLSEYLFRRILI